MQKSSQDVSSDPSTEEEGVTDPEVAQQGTDADDVDAGDEPGASPEQTNEGQEPPAQPPPTPTPDDRDPKNVAWEAKRKIDDLANTLPSLIRNTFDEYMSKIQETQQQQPPQPKYTIEQLEMYVEDPSIPPEQRSWARSEIRKLELAQIKSAITSEFEQKTKEQENKQRQIMAEQFVQQHFPECFVKDPSGRAVAWDSNNPLTKKIWGEYMNQRAIKDNPDGLIAAAKMAAFDLGTVGVKSMAKKVNKVTAQLRKEQKKTLATSSGSQPARDAGPKVGKLIEEYQKTRSSETFKEIARAKGLLPIE